MTTDSDRIAALLAYCDTVDAAQQIAANDFQRWADQASVPAAPPTTPPFDTTVVRNLLRLPEDTAHPAVVALDAIDAGDPETAHSSADELLLAAVPVAVREAYQRLVRRAAWWVTA